MVQVYKKTHEYPDPPPTPLLAFFLRYPNPFARHVLSVDVLSRQVDPITGQIHTTRLILKRGILPKWATRWLPSSATSGGRGLDAWVLEESLVDPPGWGEGKDLQGEDGEYGRQPRLRVQQGNLNHRKLMHVIEGGELRAGPNGTTLHHTTAEVRSHFGGAWSNLIRQRIESYGVGKFEGNSETSRKGMSLILSLLRNRQPLPETAEFEFYPPPPPGFNESWKDIPEAGSSQRKEGSPRSFFLSPGSLAAWARTKRANGESEQD
ncbi:uncharacterized protein IAS62_002791 [Cryptococcus decagattii]|uniref:PRELI/MSF1 domain-containing protein n=1 Tax=Cryptococcus decagattii TaxID=1859122 RepID=A0ABZ2AVK3_9TREE